MLLILCFCDQPSCWPDILPNDHRQYGKLSIYDGGNAMFSLSDIFLSFGREPAPLSAVAMIPFVWRRSPYIQLWDKSQTPLLPYCKAILYSAAWPSSSGIFIQFKDLCELTAINRIIKAADPSGADVGIGTDGADARTKNCSYSVLSLLKESHQEAWREVWLTGSISPIGACLPSWIWLRRAARKHRNW